MEILEKISNIIKTKLNSQLICGKKYLKAGKKEMQKEAFDIYMH